MATSRTRKPPKDRTIRASVSFSSKDYQELEKIALDQRVSVAWVVRDAIAKYIVNRWPLIEPSKDSK